MPELPEVETIARMLSPQIVGKRISSFHLLNPATLQGEIPLTEIIGGVFGKAQRRGKLLLLPLHFPNNPASPVLGIAMHFRMSGRIFVYPANHDYEAHTRLVFDLDDGSRIFFDDTRKFGAVHVLTEKVLQSWKFWMHLGPEPLEIDAESFTTRFAGKNRAIKTMLLDQTVIAGCGNIYADESLFRAGICPKTLAKVIPHAKLLRLHASLQEVLHEAIAACGSSIRDYRTVNGDSGAFQNVFRVYGRAGEKCIVCGTQLQKCRISGRSSVWCPHCQQ